MDQLIEKYSALPQSQRFLAVIVIIGALIAGHYYLVYTDQQLQLVHLTQEYKKKQTIKNTKENIVQYRATYEKKLAGLQQSLDEARAKLPDSANVPQLLAQLGSRARQTGLTIDSFEPLKEVTKGFYAEIAFRMKAKGSYHEVAMFIDSIGRLDRIINVSDLKMGNPETQASKVILSSTFDVKTYRFTEGSAGK